LAVDLKQRYDDMMSLVTAICDIDRWLVEGIVGATLMTYAKRPLSP
jgi:hypothetical protein